MFLFVKGVVCQPGTIGTIALNSNHGVKSGEWVHVIRDAYLFDNNLKEKNIFKRIKMFFKNMKSFKNIWKNQLAIRPDTDLPYFEKCLVKIDDTLNDNQCRLSLDIETKLNLDLDGDFIFAIRIL